MQKLKFQRTKSGLRVCEFPKKSGIKIRERINPSGKIGYRISVPARLTGKQKAEFKQKATLEEAAEWAKHRYEQTLNYGRMARHLTEEELCLLKTRSH